MPGRGRRRGPHAWVAQSVEQRTRNAQVRGSSPLPGSTPARARRRVGLRCRDAPRPGRPPPSPRSLHGPPPPDPSLLPPLGGRAPWRPASWPPTPSSTATSSGCCRTCSPGWWPGSPPAGPARTVAARPWPTSVGVPEAHADPLRGVRRGRRAPGPRGARRRDHRPLIDLHRLPRPRPSRSPRSRGGRLRGARPAHRRDQVGGPAAALRLLGRRHPVLGRPRRHGGGARRLVPRRAGRWPTPRPRSGGRPPPPPGRGGPSWTSGRPPPSSPDGATPGGAAAARPSGGGGMAGGRRRATTSWPTPT